MCQEYNFVHLNFDRFPFNGQLTREHRCEMGGSVSRGEINRGGAEMGGGISRGGKGGEALLTPPSFCANIRYGLI